MMKILLIDTINPKIEGESRLPHLGLGYLVSSIRKYFRESRFEFKIINRDINKELRAFRPNIVFITSVSQNYGTAKKYATMAGAAGIPVIVGGVHISSLPFSLTKEMDIGVIGEGEETIVGLIELLLDRKRFERQTSTISVPGIAGNLLPVRAEAK